MPVISLLLFIALIISGKRGVIEFHADYSLVSFALISSLVGFVIYFRNGLIVHRTNLLLLASLIVFILTGLMSGAENNYGIYKLYFLLELFLIALFISILPAKYFKDGLMLLPYLTIVIGILYLPVVYSGYISGNRLGFLGIGPIPTARMLLYFSIISIFYGNIRYGYRFLFFVVMGLCLWFNQSRQAFIIFSILILYIFGSVSVGVGFLGAFIFAAYNYELLDLDFFYRFAIIFDADDGNASVLTRIDGISDIIQFIKNSSGSFLTGVGAGGYVAKLKITEIVDYPHNIFAEIVFEFGFAGLAGFILYVSLAFYMLRNSSGFFLVLIALALAMVSGDLIDNRWVFLSPFIALKFKEQIVK